MWVGSARSLWPNTVQVLARTDEDGRGGVFRGRQCTTDISICKRRLFDCFEVWGMSVAFLLLVCNWKFISKKSERAEKTEGRVFL
jgi:hypothetical protein